MDDVFERRRKLVLDLIDKRFDGAKSAFARRINRSASQVGHITYPPGHVHHKDIGEDMARHIEATVGLPEGLLVMAPAETLAAATEAHASGQPRVADRQLPLHGHVRNVFITPLQPLTEDERERWRPRYATVATADPDAYLVEPGTALQPRALPGDVLLVEPHTPPEVEDDVLVRLTDGTATLGRLVSLRWGVRLAAYDDRPARALAQADVTTIHTVVAVLSHHCIFDV